jgi:hypothetical protein
MAELCPQDKLTSQGVACASVDGSGATLNIGTAPLPTELQGVFWLTEQGDSSALMSFAQTKDGGGISTGEVGTATSSTGATVGKYRVRVGGDRSWSFHDRSTNWRLAHWLDLIYNFELEYASDGSGSIVAAQIKPEAGNLFGFTLPPWLLSFRATVTRNARYTNSVVFRRDSSVEKCREVRVSSRAFGGTMSSGSHSLSTTYCRCALHHCPCFIAEI